MSGGNVVGPLIDQVGPSIADAAINHMKYYQDLKQNRPLVRPLTVTGKSWERKQKEKFKLKTKQNSLDHKKHPTQAVLNRLEQGHLPQLLMLNQHLYQRHRILRIHQLLEHDDLIKLNVNDELGAARVITLKIQQIGLILTLAESSDYSAQTVKVL